jgi:hypothetical protein
VFPSYDVFKVDEQGQPLWFAAADTLENAKARVRTLIESNPNSSRKYLNVLPNHWKEHRRQRQR